MQQQELLEAAITKAGSLNRLAKLTSLDRTNLTAMRTGRRPVSPRYEAALRRFLGESDKSIVDALIAQIGEKAHALARSVAGAAVYTLYFIRNGPRGQVSECKTTAVSLTASVF